jgi:hypothetical protein
VNLSKLYMKIQKNNSDSVSFKIYEERNQRFLILSPFSLIIGFITEGLHYYFIT